MHTADYEAGAPYRGTRMCPRCGGDSRVYRCRERADGVFIRWRFCPECGAEFPTLEVATGYMRTRKNFKNGQI